MQLYLGSPGKQAWLKQASMPYPLPRWLPLTAKEQPKCPACSGFLLLHRQQTQQGLGDIPPGPGFSPCQGWVPHHGKRHVSVHT